MTKLVQGVLERLFDRRRLDEWAAEFSVNYFLTRSAFRSYWLMARARVPAL